ncbi:MAG: CDP-archaeol synthase [Proteobacteria bacterium]|nr:CDP-archaeol synthase [Pseudomonadota bacterium]MBU1639540.1 CDP-archaeol synthase [Pseudomonadota bacterium]
MLVTAEMILFLLWVNLLPPLTHLLLGERLRWRLDGGLVFFDKQPLFGSHKTIRGVVASVLGAAVGSFFFGLPWWLAASAAFLAMVGDLLSSFIKRRLQLPVGSSVFVLDQIFEAVFPLLLINRYTSLGWLQFALVLIIFMPLAYLGACFWQYISFHPPLDNYPRFVRSTVRFREWRSCHEPLARWQTVLNLTSFLSDQIFLTVFFKITGLYGRGVANALAIKIDHQDFWLANLPASFDGFKILLLADLHLDGLDDLTENIISHVQHNEVDLCLIGGDIRMKTYGPIAPCLRHLRKLIPAIRARYGIYGVLGNHDCIEMTPDFEEVGINMLINDSVPLVSGDDTLWLVGVDDPHYYRTAHVPQAFRNIPPGKCVVFLAHSPEVYKEAARHGTSLYLCGHTHGGQICFAGCGPLVTNNRAPRFTAVGRWQFERMAGYTSRGVGASGIPLRFNCPGELSIITLRSGTRDHTQLRG